jgi:pyruvate/2-oxoglutarate dehydrogenase complex dihydrolipoamide dehydrogenase (E3) component
MQYEFDLAIIGGGSAGLLAAQIAPRIGVKAALLERSRLGGDCLWTGCVPSKTLLASAKAAHTIRSADKYGLPATDLQVDTAKVWQRIRDTQEAIAKTDDSPEKFRGLCVEVIFGDASLVDGHTVRAGERTLTARYVLICTGSRPAAPPIDGLDEVGYVTNERIFQIERPPNSLVVIGAGPIGVEMAQAMNRLGVKTTLLDMANLILEREEPALAEMLLGILRDEGVDVDLGVELRRATCEGGEKTLRGRAGGEDREWRADEILVATGRKPNIESLGLEGAGVEAGPRGIVVDRKLRSSAHSVYAVGDAAGRYLFTHSAGAETATAIRNMFYPGAKDAPGLVPWATFTDPELAHAGLTSEEARESLGEDGVRVFEWDFARNDRARADGAKGKMVAVTDRNHKILGAHILAPAAGEMIGQFTLAMEEDVRLTPDFRDLIQVYPTFSTSIPQLAEEAAYEQLEKPLYRGLRRLNDVAGI